MKYIICILRLLRDIEVNLIFLYRTWIFCCRTDRYKPNDHKLNVIPTNRLWFIATQVQERTAPSAASPDWESRAAQHTRVIWVAIKYEQFVWMAFNLWSLNSYRSALQLLWEWKNKVLFKRKMRLTLTSLKIMQETHNLFQALRVPVETEQILSEAFPVAMDKK
jgi:hypothetical protein